MAYVIAEPCIGIKDNSCVEVCPVDCIHPTPDEPGYEQADQLYIDPEECIDCDACVEACPVDAIFSKDEVPAQWRHFTDRRWSAQDDQRLTLLADSGASLEHVAQRLGRTPEAIRRRAARLKARPPAPAAAQRRGRRWTAHYSSAPALRPHVDDSARRKSRSSSE